MKLLIFIFLIIASPVYPFSYDSAIYKAQKGNWQDAHSVLSNIITDNPDRADVMYDAGVAAYNLGNKCQAATCFTRAAECSTDKHIAFCAHFNAGNTYVDEKKLERALAEYDKALAIEPDNEYARHNRDRVAQMLQEQQQKDDKQKQEQNKDDKQQDEQQDKQDGNDQQKDNQNGQDQKKQNQDQNGNDKKDGNQSQSGNDQQSNDGSEKQKQDGSSEPKSDQQSQGDRDQRDTADNSKNAQRQQHGNNKKDHHKDSGNDKKRDNKDELDKQSQDAHKEGNEQQSDKHGTTPGQQNIADDKSNVSAEDGQEQAIADPWLLRILNDQEMHDKAVNKQLMGAKIRQHGGKNGQNCW